MSQVDLYVLLGSAAANPWLFVVVAALLDEATAPSHCSIIDTSGSVRGVRVV